MKTSRRQPDALRSLLTDGIAGLYPGYFALVMATGIVSIAAHLLDVPFVARFLLWVNLTCYAILSMLLVARILFYFPRVVSDIRDHARGPGFFTVVAGTCVLGSQIVLLTGDLYAGSILWILGVALWFILMYGFFTAVTVRARKPSLIAGINGSWLLAIVATQAVSVLGSLISAVMRPWSDVLFFFTLAMYLFGCMLYLLVITLIFYRLTFFDLEAEDLTPPYWINMGAVAITTLAGATLLLKVSEWQFLADIGPFLKGFTLFFWATATWWIPLLLLLGAWRHLVQGVRLRYDPQYWGMVFPLGMYSASTFGLAQATNIPFIVPLSRTFVYVALAAWVTVFMGLLHRLSTIARRRSQPAPRPLEPAPSPGPAGRSDAIPVSLHVLCPVHGVEADVRLSVAPGTGMYELAECSLFRGEDGTLRGTLRCEGRCVLPLTPGSRDAVPHM